MKNRYTPLILLIAGGLAIFVGRTLLARAYDVPRLFDLFDVLIASGSLIILVRNFHRLQWLDRVTAPGLGAIIGAGMGFATLFSAYPFLGWVKSSAGLAVVRGLLTSLAALGGLAVMRQGGPVQLHAANGAWKEAARGVQTGLLAGLPLAVLNVFALQATQGQPIQWQNPLAALLDALQPGILEEVLYRFALWGLLWLALRNSLPRQSAWLAGALGTLVHSHAHYSDLFLQSPLLALGMGAVLALVWGLPPLLLARRNGLESAIAFHWLQDAARFLTGF